MATQNVRAANGKRYRCYQLRWFGVDGKRYSQSIGGTDKLSSPRGREAPAGEGAIGTTRRRFVL